MTKRLTLIVAALVACLAVGAVAASAKDAKIGSTIKVKYKAADPADPYATSAFSGKVGPKECAADRTVKVKGVGSESTDEKGKFRIEGDVKPGKYKITAGTGETNDGDVCKKVRTTLTVSKSG